MVMCMCCCAQRGCREPQLADLSTVAVAAVVAGWSIIDVLGKEVSSVFNERSKAGKKQKDDQRKELSTILKQCASDATEKHNNRQLSKTEF